MRFEVLVRDVRVTCIYHIVIRLDLEGVSKT